MPLYNLDDTVKSRQTRLLSFNDRRGSLPAANAGVGATKTAAFLGKYSGQSPQQADAAGPQRMADGDSAALDVHPFWADAQFFNAVDDSFMPESH